MTDLLTRRSLLRVAALAPLIIPGRVVARVGGAPAPVGPGPCGSPIPITTINQVNTLGPGCYQLTADDPAVFASIQTNDNVTLLGNGHKLLGALQVGRNDGTSVGLVVQNLSCYQIQVYGTPGTTQTATPVVHLNGITVSRGAPEAALPATIHGSNVLVENCTFAGTAGAGGTDDTLVLYNFDDPGPPAAHPTSAWCTFSNCHFGPNFDVGFEGVGNWDHVTVTNCISTQGSFGGMGAWYRYVSDPNCGFTITNCTFTGNTLTSWRFCTPQNPSDAAIGSFVDTSTSDADANAKWGTGTAFGNVFGGAGPLANTYVALTRKQCEARAALFAKYRRNPPPQWPKSTWNQKITCP